MAHYWFAVFLAAAGVNAGCVHTNKSLHIDEESWEDDVLRSDHLLTFVEFSSPWCIWAHPNTSGHGDCAMTNKAWEKLAAEHAESSITRIAEVDCSRFVHHPPREDGTFLSRESLCQRYEVKSYPTIILFNGATGQAGAPYSGGQYFEAMRDFLVQEEQKICLISPDEQHVPSSACDSNEVKYLEQWRDQPPEKLLAELTRLEDIAANREDEVTLSESRRLWMGSRINVLKQLRFVRRPTEPPKDEL